MMIFQLLKFFQTLLVFDPFSPQTLINLKIVKTHYQNIIYNKWKKGKTTSKDGTKTTYHLVRSGRKCVRSGTCLSKSCPSLGDMQNILKHIDVSNPPIINSTQIDQRYGEYLYHILSYDDQGVQVLHGWETLRRYTSLYYKISHPYLIPTPRGITHIYIKDEAFV